MKQFIATCECSRQTYKRSIQTLKCSVQMYKCCVHMSLRSIQTSVCFGATCCSSLSGRCQSKQTQLGVFCTLKIGGFKQKCRMGWCSRLWEGLLLPSCPAWPFPLQGFRDSTFHTVFHCPSCRSAIFNNPLITLLP